MGNCGSCNGCNDPSSCDDDQSRETIKIKYSTKPDDDNEPLFIVKDNKPEPSKKLLEDICNHYPYGTIERFQCEDCIKEFVHAYGYERAMEEAEKYKKLGKKVAASRLEDYAKEFKHKQRLR